ncbi:hypothetical protein H9L01_10400 [Erysipelothrix inopinata]|uniref:Lipoprotein n=1 Tax=Erysipelothrix inopinata TaxID=225084 RepID=A0A7G9RYT1_9FIRM|nr:hypothetical protein [Erysipelothrix inopinata]QNN60756.1 hypothetical protein H9L01_10400 [Erysipelothrix inopinata]
MKKEKRKFLILVILMLVLTSCTSENKRKEEIYQKNITNSLSEISKSLDIPTNIQKLGNILIFSEKSYDDNIPTILSWFRTEKNKEVNPILVVVENSKEKRIIKVIVVGSAGKYCILKTDELESYPESCDTYEDYKVLYKEDGEIGIYLSRLMQDKLIFTQVNPNR